MNTYETNNQDKIEAEYNAFMDAINAGDDEAIAEITANWDIEQPTPKLELSFSDISEQDIFTTETVVTPAPQPRRVFTESRQRFVSKKQEEYSQKLAREIRNILYSKFNEDTSAHYFHKNFTIDQKLEMLAELKAGRNFDVK